ncbi:MAG TPA: SRPBCC family protein [Chloroflexota bacterium]
MPPRAADFFIDPDIGRAEGLPARAFTEPAILDIELEKIFGQSWLLAPLAAGDVGLRGSHAPFTMLDRPLFLQRDWDGRLHCFPNACTHAWFPLVPGAGRERTIVCRQHGRRFDSAGRFLGQPGFEDVAPRPEDSLRDVPLAEWNGLLLVALKQPAMALDELLQDVSESVACLPLGDLKRRPRSAELREVDGNWKQHAWNYMDVFHLTFIHRAPGGLADALDMDSYRTELHAYTALQWAYAANPEHGFEPDLLPARFRHPSRRVFALWWFVFPNMTLNFYPWGLSVNVYMPRPGRPARTLFLWQHYVLDERRYEQRDTIWLNHQVDAEDVDAMRQVSSGLRAPHVPRGRFAPGHEAGPHWFHRLVYTSLFEPIPERR